MLYYALAAGGLAIGSGIVTLIHNRKINKLTKDLKIEIQIPEIKPNIQLKHPVVEELKEMNIKMDQYKKEYPQFFKSVK